MMAVVRRNNSVHFLASAPRTRSAKVRVRSRPDSKLSQLQCTGDIVSYFARPLDAEQTRVLRHDAVSDQTGRAVGYENEL